MDQRPQRKSENVLKKMKTEYIKIFEMQLRQSFERNL